MNEWRTTTWGEIASLAYGRALRTYGADGAVPVFGTNGPIGFTQKALATGPGVIIGRKGAYRGVHYSAADFFVIDTAFYLCPKPGVPLDLRWAYYNLLHQDINSMDSGSAIPSTSRDDFYSLPVEHPPIDDQRAIAAILGALDDKIDLNRQMNHTLEEMASALFKSWFIDFDPVVAKAEGRQPFGMDAATAALFPAALRDSDEGLIPSDWVLHTLRDALDINPKRQLDSKRPAPYLDMASTPTAGHAPSSFGVREPISGVRFMNGDTLLAKITPCLENGKAAYVDFLADGQVGWGSTEFIVMRPKPPIPLPFAYLLARHSDFKEHAIQSMTGSSGRQRVDLDSLCRWKLALPSNTKIFNAFGGLIQPWFALAGANAKESQTLTALRDLLLPQLLSGEIRIKDAEKLVEAAV